MNKITSVFKARPRAFIASGVLLILALFFRFCLLGFGMTALCLLGLAVCVAAFALFDIWNAQKLRVALIAVLVIGFGCFMAGEIPVLMDARSAADTSADYIIVFGAGVNGTEPSLSLTNRLHGALSWLEENPDGKAVLSGGQGPHEAVTEAQAMYDWLTARGVDPARLIMEDQASDSYENLVNSLVLIANRGGDPHGRVAILSSEYHLHRLRYMAERLGCQPVSVAARTTNPVIFLNYAVRESFAMWELWVFGM